MEIQCPNCNITLDVRSNSNQTVCPKCLERTGKRFIMIESNEKGCTNLGDGFFQKNED